MHAVKFACGSLVVDVLLVAAFELLTSAEESELPDKVEFPLSTPPEVSAAETVK